MADSGTIVIVSNRKEVELDVDRILYVQMKGNLAMIHLSKESVYQTRMTLAELEGLLGDKFIKVKRGCLVSTLAIHSISDKVNLCNGESLDYVVRNKKELLKTFREKQKLIIKSFNEDERPETEDQYHDYYRVFDKMPFAFADIEMVFDSECHAVDWIFRYGNQELARLEKLPLEKMIGHSFHSLFPNMDSKWLRSYERATLFGEMLKIIDYSPEIDKYLEIICFPTLKGHCGCMLFDVAKIRSFRKSTDAEKALAFFIGKIINTNQ